MWFASLLDTSATPATTGQALWLHTCADAANSLATVCVSDASCSSEAAPNTKQNCAFRCAHEVLCHSSTFVCARPQAHKPANEEVTARRFIFLTPSKMIVKGLWSKAVMSLVGIILEHVEYSTAVWNRGFHRQKNCGLDSSPYSQ